MSQVVEFWVTTWTRGLVQVATAWFMAVLNCLNLAHMTIVVIYTRFSLY